MSDVLSDFDVRKKLWDCRTRGSFFGRLKAANRVLLSHRALASQLKAADRAVREAVCTRFMVTPCRKRPEIEPRTYCACCKYLAKFKADSC